MFVELKELKDTIFYKGEGMLNQLRTELELYNQLPELRVKKMYATTALTEPPLRLPKMAY